MIGKMRAVVVNKPENTLSIGEVALPECSKDEILVRVKYFAVNRLDIIQKNGNYPPPAGASEILGVEFSGTVEATCASSDLKVGDRLFGLVPGGCYAEFVKINSKMAMRIPDGMSFKDAAALPEVWFTASQALILISKLKKQESVLIHAAGLSYLITQASGVGTAAIQISKLLGAKNIIVTAGSEDKLAFCKGLGATCGINYKTTPKFSKDVLEATDGKGVDVLMDFVGATHFEENLNSMAVDARMTMQGSLAPY